MGHSACTAPTVAAVQEATVSVGCRMVKHRTALKNRVNLNRSRLAQPSIVHQKGSARKRSGVLIIWTHFSSILHPCDRFQEWSEKMWEPHLTDQTPH